MSLTTPEKVWQLQAALHAKAKSEPMGNHDRQPLVCESMNTLNESRMPETGLSGLMSGEWKRSAGRDLQAPATERAGHSYGLAYTPPRHSSTLQIARGAAAKDFGWGQGGEVGASPQRAVTAEPTQAPDKRPAARLFRRTYQNPKPDVEVVRALTEKM